MATLCLMVAGCSSTPPTRADLGAQAACNAQADDSYERQNRDAIYQNDNFESSLKDAPYSSSGTARNEARGLSAQYARAQAVQNCLQGIGEPPATNVQVAPLTPAPKK